jgi:hypothetical protein
MSRFWKLYNQGGYPCFRGGSGTKDDGKPGYVTFHPATNYPKWDWVEGDDGAWIWIGNSCGQNAGDYIDKEIRGEVPLIYQPKGDDVEEKTVRNL